MSLKYWKDGIQQNIELMSKLIDDNEVLEAVQKSADICVESLKNGGRILFCGNGGSASDAQHLATELVSRFLRERKALDAEAVTVNTSSLTAIANDYDFSKVFSRQIEAKGRKGDILFGITTSGNSANVIEAVKSAKEIGMVCIGLTGDRKDSLLYSESDICICVPSKFTPRIQEAHILLGHMLCGYIEDAFAE